jgi:transketolase
MHFGVREHAMGSVVNGMALHGGLRPYAATFLVFADYMRPPIRLAAMMGLPVVYIFTHDSIYVGEDGPTHQPVEQLASLRIIPGLRVLRPADGPETAIAWKMALERSEGPTALALSRQNLTVFPRLDGWSEDAERGAYVARDGAGTPEVVLVATGSEVELALKAAEAVDDVNVRVVSVVSRELFQEQDKAFRERILPPGVPRMILEVGVRAGWEGVAAGGALLTLDRFGESGPGGEVGRHLGFTTENVVSRIRTLAGV